MSHPIFFYYPSDRRLLELKRRDIVLLDFGYYPYSTAWNQQQSTSMHTRYQRLFEQLSRLYKPRNVRYSRYDVLTHQLPKSLRRSLLLEQIPPYISRQPSVCGKILVATGPAQYCTPSSTGNFGKETSPRQSPPVGTAPA